VGVCAYCAQIALRIKAYFFRVAQFALRIYKIICVYAIYALKKNRANCSNSFKLFTKCCNSVFVKVIFLKENVKKNCK